MALLSLAFLVGFAALMVALALRAFSGAISR